MKILDVPFFDQKDNGPNGWRQCQTSSLAMCLNYIGIKQIEDDTDYLRVVKSHGDTTLQLTHIKAMYDFGVTTCKFSTVLKKEDLISQIDKDFPVAIGILHHGHVSYPTGGGHYIVLRGYDDKYAYVHDPYGELDLVNGGWCSSAPQAGRDQKYSWKNLIPRWDLGGGWGWMFSKHYD